MKTGSNNIKTGSGVTTDTSDDDASEKKKMAWWESRISPQQRTSSAWDEYMRKRALKAAAEDETSFGKDLG